MFRKHPLSTLFTLFHRRHCCSYTAQPTTTTIDPIKIKNVPFRLVTLSMLLSCKADKVMRAHISFIYFNLNFIGTDFIVGCAKLSPQSRRVLVVGQYLATQQQQQTRQQPTDSLSLLQFLVGLLCTATTPHVTWASFPAMHASGSCLITFCQVCRQQVSSRHHLLPNFLHDFKAVAVMWKDVVLLLLGQT